MKSLTIMPELAATAGIGEVRAATFSFSRHHSPQEIGLPAIFGAFVPCKGPNPLPIYAANVRFGVAQLWNAGQVAALAGPVRSMGRVTGDLLRFCKKGSRHG